MSETESKEVLALLNGCLRADRDAQRKLYKLFFGYAMRICVCYSQDAEKVREVLNDGFLKVFNRLEQYDNRKPFQGWLRRIMINTALDNYRHNLKHYHLTDIGTAIPVATGNSVEQQLGYNDLLLLVRALSPAYRAVFNLYAIDSYKHEEIAKMLHIRVGTFKSNMAKARANLKEALKRSRIDEYKQYV